MTNGSLAQSYLKKAIDRLDVLDVLQQKGAYSDVVPDAQRARRVGFEGAIEAGGY